MITFEIVTPANVTCRTFDNVTDARRYVLAHKHDLPGLRIDRVEVITVRGASLDGALIRNRKVSRLLASVGRLIDPYVFYGFELADNGGVKIMAGCRWFTLAEFRSHVAEEYPDTDKATETLQILDFIEARAKALGVES